MSEKAKETERLGVNRKDVPILSSGIGTRIKFAAERVGARKSAAKAAGVSEDMLYRYIREQASPSFAAMSGLALAARVRMEWIATGEGDPGPEPSLGRPDIDLDALEQVVVKTRRMLLDRNINLKPEAEARVIRLIYEFYLRQGEPMDEASLNNVIELAAFR